MRVIIVGCGKLGSGLAKALTRKGNQVTIIDSNADAFELLDKDFSGKTIAGIGFDRDILEKANISHADAIIACSKSDEINALIGKIARDIYRVPRVISRLYDPRRAEIYHSLGIQTLSTTTWGFSVPWKCSVMTDWTVSLQSGTVRWKLSGQKRLHFW